MINQDLIENLMRYNPNEYVKDTIRCIDLAMRKKDSDAYLVECDDICCETCKYKSLKLNDERFIDEFDYYIGEEEEDERY